MRPTYTPTEEERKQIREFILKNSGYTETGQLVSEKKREGALYPKGFTSFADKAHVSYRALSNLLNGNGPCIERTWYRIRGEMDRHTAEYKREMAVSLIRIAGGRESAIREILEVA